ncbi:hypothetical protein SAMN05660860_01389 [Geoalkalibacter ferrihydriticus]|uniref:Uncharacterized protein n=2 Tax=Geoalkalibacter ferrihydriticus TaxID=392333 RepID=A0A0C2DWM8_9BACT|nr:hypothetical protein [Geoalkalibacter ferrihydriticus]KIH77864.1 hypothetical protein GFER_04355 [Geoalkalibacter ferrihydriticus DSM 17813]SDL83093.1 hypothetical protein SAMN05660860_01389 [Geoalkalibacter ferrihydriticus]
MQTRKLAFLTALLLSAAMLWGCGSSGSGGTDVQPIDPADVQTVGIFNCSTCHAGGPQVAKWLDSKHAAGSYGGSTGACLACHDPDGDGAEVMQAFGLAGTNVVGCEACHGGGSAHRGLGPLPFPEPGVAQCAQCHTELSPRLAGHLANNPFSNLISERFLDSRHAGTNVNTQTRANSCAACHSHEGAVLYLNAIAQDGSRDLMVRSGVLGLESRLTALGTATDLSVKTCTSCHDAHSGELLGLGEVIATPAGATSGTGPAQRTVFSAEFNLCTACHQVNLDFEFVPGIGYNEGGMYVYTLADTYHAGETYDADANNFHAGGAVRVQRSIVDTHFQGLLNKEIFTNAADLPLFAMYEEDEDGLNYVVPGYNINPASENACTACHDPHSASKFGENFLTDADSFFQAVAYAQGVGETHGNYISDSFSREQSANSCTPCHTGRQLPNVVNGLSRADLGSVRWNPLGCVTCHPMTEIEGPATVADTAPREFVANYEFAFNSGEVVPVEELGRNQVCFECHKGRTPGVDVSSLPEGPTNHFNISYLHYSPIFATYYGDESGMVATYEGILEGVTYRGKSTTHSANPANDVGGGFTYGVEGGATCLDCHDVHTNSIRESNPNIRNGITCVTCHGEDWNQRAAKGNVTALADLLIDVVYDELMATVNAGFNANLTAFLDALHAELDEVVGKDMVKSRIKERTIAGGWPTRELAHAVTTWKVFYYEDRASWAHNRNFAYQMFRDAIESLGVEYQDPPGFNLGSFSSWTSLDRPEPIN